MKRLLLTILCLIIFFTFNSCNNTSTIPKEDDGHAISDIQEVQKNFLTEVIPQFPNGEVNAVIEIPAGSIEKWELDKSTGRIERDSINDLPRTINYLGYPVNYGMIPGTLLSTEQGGDGDPLDVIVLGPVLAKGTIIRCKIIGVLYLTDSGQQDDKLIGVAQESLFASVENLSDLKHNYEGLLEILELWFTNYKGPQKMESLGFGNKSSAMEILNSALVDQ